MIEFRKVSFRYGHGFAGTGQPCGVTDIDLRVEAGRCVLVCGASGSGKSTILRLANGLAPSFFSGALEGEVLLDGIDVASMASWEVAAHVGSVFQNPRTQFFNVDSTGEVAFALESAAWDEEAIRRRVAQTAAELDIEELMDRNIFSLSGGEKQRIAYASARAPHPANLVLDEPTSNLDLGAIEQMRRYVAAAKAAGAAVLVAEHRLWWLMDVVDEFVVLEGGRIVRRMESEEFCALPSEDVRAMGLRNRALADLRAMPHGNDPAPAGAPLIFGHGLAASYGKQAVFGPLDIAVHAGEVMALVGRNGAGKSTLCRVLAGLHPEDAGRVEVGGVPLSARERVRRAYMVFQDVNYQLFADSVHAEVIFGIEEGRCPPPEEVDAILTRLGLSAEGDRHPATLSGGQKQRLAVAASLASGRDLLFFDEPTSGLDLGGCARVASLVRSLAAEGRAVLVVTHDLEFIAAACDRAALLSNGRIDRLVPVMGDLSAVRGMLRDTVGPAEDAVGVGCDERTRRGEGWTPVPFGDRFR